MPNSEHLLERRVRILSEAITKRTNLLKNALLPPGSRPPFTTQLSEGDALAFWRRNRNLPLGRAVLERMTPEAIMELDLTLSQIGKQEENFSGV